MAQTLRWPSSLKKQANRIQAVERGKTFRFYGLCLLAGLVLYFAANKYLSPDLEFFTSTSGILIIIAVIAGRKAFSSDHKRDKLLKGLHGEMLVARELDRLPEGWFIINDLVVDGVQIDHVAVSTRGVFCLETKNWNNAGCDENGIWYRFHLGRWLPLEESPARQNLNHVRALKNYLKRKLALDVKINSIVVLAYPGGKFNLKSRVIPPGASRICLPSELRRFLLQQENPILPPKDTSKIARALAKT
jgi:hypothetical protein